MTNTIKKGLNNAPFDFSDMKDPDAFVNNGYQLQAMSTNGNNLISSYIAKYKGKRIYGYYDYQKGEYIEEIIC
ncbi:hypothetical protein JUJ52_02975 [Virgibacillus sp. AGTR]|uniref:hypothetical protein n=1 Tax=Virgibacillus sp. AGTR TaxID=2812055 RepID=UPI001D16715B|nr:hypothetical protein [Virgibacillus sp. AGTR]MCC2248920.1 hypothetical protein [Virgibacillus sp. AGTR]